MNEIFFMNQAILEAKKAASKNEVLVGAVIVKNNEVLASGHNQVIGLSDPTAHAEIITIRKASKKINNYRLLDCHLYVTLEPCLMCLGTIINARISCVTFALFDPKSGVINSNTNVFTNNRLNHHTSSKVGPFGEESAKLLKDFFLLRRELKKTNLK